MNTIAHRNYMGAPIQISVYDDKLIVWNEGALPEYLTIEDLKKKHSSRPHNPILASAFFKGGLIEAWGRGTIKIINEYKNAGLPEPIIENTLGGISVTILKKEYSLTERTSKLVLNERQLKAVEYLKERGRITNKEYQQINNVSQKTSTRDLKVLVDNNIILLNGVTGAGAFYELIVE